MKINEVVQPINEDDRPLTPAELDQIEAFADKVFSKVGIDVNFTRHFIDRVNDERNKKQITASELTRLFKQIYKRHGKKIAQLGPDAQAVMVDLNTDVNMPFALDWDEQNQELDLFAKTIMRKKDFKTSNQKFAVESETVYEGFPLAMNAGGSLMRGAAVKDIAKYVGVDAVTDIAADLIGGDDEEQGYKPSMSDRIQRASDSFKRFRGKVGR